MFKKCHVKCMQIGNVFLAGVITHTRVVGPFWCCGALVTFWLQINISYWNSNCDDEGTLGKEIRNVLNREDARNEREEAKGAVGAFKS